MDLTGYTIDSRVADSDSLFYVVTVITPAGQVIQGKYEPACDFEPKTPAPQDLIDAVTAYMWESL